MAPADATSEVFIEVRWNYRTWRSYAVIILCGSLGGLPLFAAIHSFIYQTNLYRRYLWLIALGIFSFGAFFCGISLVTLVRVVRGTEETSRIDTQGVRIGSEIWRWDQLRWIYPKREAGGGIFLIFCPKKRADRWFWVGRPLNEAEYKHLCDHLFPFLEAHYPHLL